MTTDYNEIYTNKLEEMKNRVLNGTINDRLKLKAISNVKIDEIIQKMNEVLKPRQVWDDFNFRTGKILGILRSIAQNPKLRTKLLEITGLTQNHIDLYFEVCGNLPFLVTSNNTINPGRPMMINEAKEFITLVGLEFGYVIEENDLYDITEERWHQLYNNTMERLKETVEHNKKNADNITEYEE